MEKTLNAWGNQFWKKNGWPLLNSNSDAGQMKKNVFTNLPISQIFGVPKLPYNQNSTNLGGPKKIVFEVVLVLGRPWLHWAHLSQHSRDAPFASFSFVPSLEGGREPTEDEKSWGHSMTPTQTTNFFFRKSLQKLCGWICMKFLIFARWVLVSVFFDQNENGNLSNHLRTLRQQWASSCSLISLLSVKILPWQKNTYR